MENQDVLTRLNVDRTCIERDLAVGDLGRARRRAGRAVAALVADLRQPEPELSGWLRILAALARVDRPARRGPQLPLWPELDPAGAEASAASSACDRKQPHGHGVITLDRRMLSVLTLLERLAPTDLPVLIEGESGTGKEVVARAIHAMSRRTSRPWVTINCGALPPQLQESELFGHTRGAFTGAATERAGLFEAADGGTIFLDEIGEMDSRAQVKLLRVLESGELRRLGEVRTRQIDVRVVAATNTAVDEAVRAGRFRKDLLYRLGAVRACLPPLRERRADVLPLTQHFVRQATTDMPIFTPGARAALLDHDWPGNVRELKFVIERAIALWEQGRCDELPAELLFLSPHAAPRWLERRAGQKKGGTERAQAGTDATRHTEDACLPAGHSLEEHLGAIERRLIVSALQRAGGNRTAAARLLGGLSRTTLIGKMKRLGLCEPLQAAQGG